MSHLDGTAGRALGRRIGVMRGERKDRVASNDNEARPVSLAQANREAEKPAREVHRTSTHIRMPNEMKRPMTAPEAEQMSALMGLKPSS